MGDFSTPFTASPPYVQLLVVSGDGPTAVGPCPGPLVINTGIFIGSALVQKALGVDILPIVNWVPGHPEGGCGGQLCILGGFGWVHICMYNGNTVRDIIIYDDLRHNFLRPPGDILGPLLIHSYLFVGAKLDQTVFSKLLGVAQGTKIIPHVGVFYTSILRYDHMKASTSHDLQFCFIGKP